MANTFGSQWCLDTLRGELDALRIESLRLFAAGWYWQSTRVGKCPSVCYKDDRYLVLVFSSGGEQTRDYIGCNRDLCKEVLSQVERCSKYLAVNESCNLIDNLIYALDLEQKRMVNDTKDCLLRVYQKTDYKDLVISNLCEVSNAS